MEPDGDIVLNILLLLALIVCNAFFAMSEIAIISLNDNKVRKMAQEGHKRADIIVRLIEYPSKFLATIQVGVTLSGFLASAVAADTFAEHIVYALRNVAISPSALRAISIVGITIVLSFVTLVFGELVPKRVGMQNCEKISFGVAPALSMMARIGAPFVALLSATTNGTLRLLGINPNDQPEQVTEEEIRMLIDVGNESGNIEQTEKEMINNIFEFDDRTVEEMMTHRTEIVAVELDTPLNEIIKVAVESGNSRIPAYEDDLDSIKGILYVKDLLELVLTSPGADFDLSAHLREPLYVLESTSCMALLKDFKARKIQMAIVVDEYGGTSGLVTMEDLLESIVGNIQDEYDDEEDDISTLSDSEYMVDGLTPLDDVVKFFDLSILNEDEFDTIGGYVVSQLGRIPAENEHPSVTIGGVSFTIHEMDERRVSKLLARSTVADSAVVE